MQSVSNLNSNHGLPLCLAGITHTLTLYKEMEDHDRRREAMKKQKSQVRECSHADHEMGIQRNHERDLGEIRGSEIDEDLASVISDLLSCKMPQYCTAKAA